MLNVPIPIAYADDHTASRKTIAKYLEYSGKVRVIVQANTGTGLIRRLTEQNPLPDLCLLDMHMPGLEGWELLKKIKQRWPRMRTLILTAFEEDIHVLRMISFGANGYLLKSASLEEIIKAIECIMDYGYYYSSVAGKDKFISVYHKEIRLAKFSSLEHEFLRLAVKPITMREIAARMEKSEEAIEGYRKRVYQKLGVNSRPELLLAAVRHGIITMEIHNAKLFDL